MKPSLYIVGSGLFAFLWVIGVTTYLKKNKQVAYASEILAGDGTWTVYTTAHGLPSGSVHRVVVADDGQIWAGFEKGRLGNPYNEIIGRFDGYTWTNYYLPGCTVTALTANEDDIYAGTRCGGGHGGFGYGFHWFVDDTWVDFMPADGDGMQGDYIWDIKPENENKIWFSAGYNDVCYAYANLLDHKGTADKSDDEWTVYDFWNDWGICSVYNIGIDPQGNRWFSTSDDIRVLTVDNEWISYPMGGGDFAFDENGNIWSGSSWGVSKFDGTSWVQYDSREEAIEQNFVEIMSSIDKSQVGGYYSLWAIEDPAGVWIMQDVRDVRFYDGQDWTIYALDNPDLSGYHVTGIAVDQQGNVWFANRDGIPVEYGLTKFTPDPNYILQAAPDTVFLEQGGETAVNLDITRLRGWVPTATLTVTGLHPSVSAVFNTNPVSPTERVQLTLTSAPSTPISIYEFDVEATTSDGLVRTETLTLHIVEELFQSFFPGLFKA